MVRAYGCKEKHHFSTIRLPIQPNLTYHTAQKIQSPVRGINKKTIWTEFYVFLHIWTDGNIYPILNLISQFPFTEISSKRSQNFVFENNFEKVIRHIDMHVTVVSSACLESWGCRRIVIFSYREFRDLFLDEKFWFENMFRYLEI